MAQMLTVELARQNIGNQVLQRQNGGGRPWNLARLVDVVNDEIAVIKPSGHKKEERVPIKKLKLTSKHFGLPNAKADNPNERWYIRNKDGDILVKAGSKFIWQPLSEAVIDVGWWYPSQVQANCGCGRLGLKSGKGMHPQSISIVAMRERLANPPPEPIQFPATQVQITTADDSIDTPAPDTPDEAGTARLLTQEEAERTAAAFTLGGLKSVSPDPAPIVTPAPTPISDPVRAAFTDWANKTRESAVAEGLRLESLAVQAVATAELTIALRRKELGFHD